MKPSNSPSLVGRILIPLCVLLACPFLSRAQAVKKSPPPSPPQTGGWRILTRLRRLRVAYRLRFCLSRRIVWDANDAGKGWAIPCFALNQPPAMRLWRPALAAYHP